ncbi:M1 family metallopeptidase [Chryseolinea lacunae]|uniref:M1 family metallopeptidase n=1 Tax=Chryseolinea lacunae TaxID=2801331 RepID=A0ABS1KUW0_9BACT|nr:M1 family metallopeptidase [Chryseolinea lacunae]MBL0743007.1 M1 family metallopeptidase [Chryseolinea lacunae]
MIRIALLVFASLQCLAQTQLPVATNFRKSYRDHVRDRSGVPGKNYWQNRADYSIRVQFSPETRLLSGHVDIQYLNNSPDTLSKVVFKLFPNLYKTESIRAKPVSGSDLGKGVDIESLVIDGQSIDSKKISIRGTNMTVQGVTVLPGNKLSVSLKYSYLLNEHSFIRTGQVDPGAFVVAYFFPRIAVYDDIDGWNEYAYMGFDEFYNDYGDFHVEISVPGDYQVWCTGDLINAWSVLHDKEIQRIEKASTSDGIVDIITKEDIAAGFVSKSNVRNTWIFEATDVPDVAFTTSNHYIWKSGSVLVDSAANKRVRVDAVYNPDHIQYEPVVGYAKGTVSAMRNVFPKVVFPYSHITIFDGLDAMEYPMMVNNLPFEEAQQIVQFTAHEVFHTLFPFYVGTNETKYSFMDEGLATLAEFTLPPLIAPEVPIHYEINEVNETAGADYDNPIITLTPQLNRKSRFSNKDLKPALGFHYVKDMLGDEKFSEALRYFIVHWKGKHPSPNDFFNCMNTGAGVDLSWFWVDWFYNQIRPDLAIGNVTHRGSQYVIEVKKAGVGSTPVHLDIEYSDGTHEQRSSHIGCWSKGNNSVVYKIKTAKQIQRIVLGNAFDADIDKSNNVWNKQ